VGALPFRRNRYPYNHRTGMLEMDKIVSGKRSWVSLRQPNLQVRAIGLMTIPLQSVELQPQPNHGQIRLECLMVRTVVSGFQFHPL
jgi:hypothetical protein